MSQLSEKILNQIKQIMKEENVDIHVATNIWLERLIDKKEQASK